MMYQDQFVAVVKCKGKVLREQGDIVQLPFGSEYSILLKNLSTKRAVVTIEIDGREVTDGGLVVDANRDVELERFIDTGDLNKGYRFKFIQKTKEVQNFRGDKVDDGIIRIEWQYEVEPIIQWATNFTIRNNTPWRASGSEYVCGRNLMSSNITKSADVFCCSVAPESASPMLGFGDQVQEASDKLNDSPLEDEGITVEGSDSNQKFRTVHVGSLESQKHCIVLKLVGATKEEKPKPIQKPVYVKTTVRCQQCGKVHEIAASFCSRCGARLLK